MGPGIVFILFTLVTAIRCDINPAWRDPSAFERHQRKNIRNDDELEGSGQIVSNPNERYSRETCGTVDPYVDAIAAQVYKKFVYFIFNRKKLLKDELTNTYLRDIQFQVTEEELQKLESTSDIREIDGIISDIIFKSKDSSLRNIVLTEFSYRLSNLAYLFHSKNGMFVLGGICFVLFIWCISRYSRKGIIVSALLAALIVSYTITYMQCNNKKATDKLIKLMEHDGKFSCPNGEKEEAGFFNSVWGIFRSTPQSKCIAKMREMYLSDLDICTPAEVLVVMIAQLNVQYFKEFGHQLIDMYNSLTESAWWYEKPLILIILLSFFAMVVYAFIKFFLKYGFQYAATPAPSNQGTDPAHKQLLDSMEQLKTDCAKLKKSMKRKVGSSKPQIIIMEKAATVNRVEEILPKVLTIDQGGIGDGLHMTVDSASEETSDLSDFHSGDESMHDNETSESKVKQIIDAKKKTCNSWKGPYKP